MLTVRLLHVLAMALVLGGATVTWWLFRQSAVGGETAIDAETAVGTAAVYERGFWGAMGVLVMTGVGNLGSLAPYVPGSETRWGTVFAAKLLLVIAVLALSVVRTLVVHRCRRAETTPESPGGVRTLRVGYAATALSLAVIVALAEVLAHG